MDSLPAKPKLLPTRKRTPDGPKSRSDKRTNRQFAKESSVPVAGPPVPADSGNAAFGQDDFVAFERSESEEIVETDPPPGARAKDKAGEPSRKRKADELDYSDNHANRRPQPAATTKAPWIANLDWERCNNVAELLHREVEAYVKYISPTPVEDEIRSLLVTLISRAVQTSFPDAQVFPFGSYETKLYLPLGDIDLVVHSQSMAYSKTMNVLYALANTMKRAGITDKVTVIGKAKVPIIKFVTTLGRFSVDISVNQVNGVAAGEMVKKYLAELPALRSLVLIIKSFLSQRSMNEVFTGGLGSYSIVCLAISFLQMHPKIRRGEIDPSKNLGVLVMEFFELYGRYFNYNEVGISLHDGGTYYNKAQRGWLDYRNPYLLSIEDPGDPSNDISRGSYAITKVRVSLAGAHGIMTAAAFMLAGMISARREGRSVSLRDTINPADMSILAGVMGVTQETINHRRVVQEVFDEKTLHRMVGVTPKAVVAPPPPPPPQPAQKGKRRASERPGRKGKVIRATAEAEAEADMELESNEEHDLKDRDEDESRYAIDARPPPKKRQRTGKVQDVHTVYTTDDDDDNEIVIVETQLSDDSLAAEDDEYDVGEKRSGAGEASTPKKSVRGERNRSYWLSKGIGS